MSHPNAVLTPCGRRRLVALVEEQQLTFPRAAAFVGVSIATAWEWVTRWRPRLIAGELEMAHHRVWTADPRRRIQGRRRGCGQRCPGARGVPDH
jgi:transposase